MFKQIKEFFFGNKPAPVETTTQEVPLNSVDVAIKNIKETTESVTAKVEAVPVKEKPWTEKTPASITTKPRQQSTKAVPAPKRKKPASK